ncbi:MAG: hypothetical protein ACXVRN_03505 [Solirubrobacteraceae bacterium]
MPKRTDTEYVVHDFTGAGFAAWVLGDVEAIVDVGVVLVGVVAGLAAVDVCDVVEDWLVGVLGAGDTIATVEVALDEDGVALDALVVDDVDDEPDDDDAGLELSFGTALANGLRAMRASTILAGSLESTFFVVEACVPAGVAAGGAGTVGVVLADALLSRKTGTAATATRRSATTIHSLRSTRSRRSELILVLRSSRRPERSADRWLP